MRGLIGNLCIKTYLVNQNPAETCQVFGKNFSGQLYPARANRRHSKSAILYSPIAKSDRPIALFLRGISPLNAESSLKIALFSYHDYGWQD
jgi:hypothetical protein